MHQSPVIQHLQAALADYNAAYHDGASSAALQRATTAVLEARKEAASPEARITKLHHDADAHNKCADRQAERAVEYFDRAAIRRVRASRLPEGPCKDAELAQAADFQRLSDNYQACCDAELLEALRLRREACLLRHRLNEAAALAGVVR